MREGTRLISEGIAIDTVALAEAAALATWPGAFFILADNPDRGMIDLCERALIELDRDDPARVRVLAALASNLAFADDVERQRQLIDEAYELAEQHGDAALIGAVLNSEFVAMWDPSTFERRKQIGPRLTEIGEQIGDYEMQYLGRFFTTSATSNCARFSEQLLPFRGQVGVTATGTRLYGLVSRSLGELALALGDHDAAVEVLEEAVAHADASGMVFERVISRRLLAQAQLAHGAADKARKLIDEALPAAEERGYDREVALLQGLGDR